VRQRQNDLFVGTKRQAQASRGRGGHPRGHALHQPALAGRLLTNWVTVQKSVKRLQELDEMATDGRYELLTKKEVIKLERGAQAPASETWPASRA